jgi:hypothetical protein
MRLLDTRTTSTGVTINRFAPTGDPEYGLIGE